MYMSVDVLYLLISNTTTALSEAMIKSNQYIISTMSHFCKFFIQLNKLLEPFALSR